CRSAGAIGGQSGFGRLPTVITTTAGRPTVTSRRAKQQWRPSLRAGGERKAMSEWVVHCEVNQRHIRHSQPTREAALKYACSQLLQGHAVNRIVGPNETITAERVRRWCAKHRASPTTQVPDSHIEPGDS